MQNHRLFEMVYLLMNQKTMTAKELADHFEVSTRTILRDVETLSMAGVPIYTTKGKNGGISLLDGFVINKTVLTEEEQVQMIAALQGLSATDHADHQKLLNRLGALFQKNDTTWIEVDYSNWGDSEENKKKFELLKDAVILKKAISFEYPSPFRKTVRRTVYPLKLIFKSRSWYLQGYCLLRKNYRTFKISRILRPEILEEFFDEEKYVPPAIEASGERSEKIIVKLKFSPNAAYRIYDEFGEKDVSEEGGHFLVSIETVEEPWLYSYILSFGSDVEVLEPIELREKMLQQITSLQEKYIPK